MDNKQRLDILLVEKALVKSRGEASLVIQKGLVKVDGKVITVQGHKVKKDANIEFTKQEESFSSRGGDKLRGALNDFKVDVKHKICLDIGASTGGFTDCLLKAGAIKVYAVDVGYGQLDWKLRNDDRVICIEKTNARNWDGKEIKDKIDLVVIDVSFISLKLIIPNVKKILGDSEYKVLALIKPQFEVGKDHVGKGGVVREEKYRLEAVESIKEFSKNINFEILGVCESPLKGPAGNVEYFIYLS